MYVSQCSESFAFEGSTPADGDTGVAVDTAFELTFSDFPDPGGDPSTLAAGLLLRSGMTAVAFTASVDLIDKSIVIHLARPLRPDTQYQLLVGTKLQSLCNGTHLGEQATINFQTAAAAPSPDGGPIAIDGATGDGGVVDGGPIAPPVDLAVAPDLTSALSTDMSTAALGPPVPRTLSADVQPIFDGYCAIPQCHDGDSLVTLHLTDAMAATDLLQCSTSDNCPPRSAEKTNLALVKPFDPANSYLLRKLVGTPDIRGAMMPLNAGLIDPVSLRIISDWIATGAQP